MDGAYNTIALVVLVWLNDVHSSITYFRQNHFEIRVGETLNSVYKHQSASSIIECASLCLSAPSDDGGCTTAGFGLETKDCQFSHSGGDDVLVNGDGNAIILIGSTMAVEERRVCDEENIINGSLTYDSRVPGSIASVDCINDHVPNTSTVTCLDTGLWEPATCSYVDCGTQLVTQGAMSHGSTNHGSTASVSCNSGYVASVSTVTCLPSGQWEPVSCTFVDCGTPSVDQGSVSHGSTSYGSTASVSCNTGYVTSVPTVTCLATGQWEPVSCIIADCGISIITQGAMSHGLTSYGSIASVSCNSGYVASVSTVTCLATGQWEPVSCIIAVVDCGSPSVDQGSVSHSSTSYGSVASVSCNTGYVASVSTVTCLTTGQWEPVSCNIVDCGTVEYPNADVMYADQTWYLHTAVVYCHSGFQLRGNLASTTITCESDGNWNLVTELDPEPECWKLMFRGTAGNGDSPVDAYINGNGDVTNNDPDCMVVQDNGCTSYYRHPDLDNWSTIGVRKVRYEMYNNGETVMSTTFDGTGSSFEDWMWYPNGGTWRLLDWPWTDLSTTSASWLALRDWDESDGRSFRMIRNYGGCFVDYYYTVVLYNPTYGCPYENHTLWPKFLYAIGTTGAEFGNTAYGMASVMAIWVYHD